SEVGALVFQPKTRF
nr:RecName: Full=30 kDa cell wall protein [Daucus carota]